MPMKGAWPEIEWTWEQHFNLKVKQDFENHKVVFTATIPNNTYLAIAFGHDMIGTDMILWQANGSDSAVHDMWSTNFATPMFDKFDHTTSTIAHGKIGTGKKIFTTSRSYDTMDD